VGDEDVLLDKRPPEAVAAPVDDVRLVESSNNPLREEDVAPRALEAEAIGGAGAFVTLLRFFPNFFFVPDKRELFLFIELISGGWIRGLVTMSVCRQCATVATLRLLQLTVALPFFASVPEARRIVRVE
jgi:hypothetical protein